MAVFMLSFIVWLIFLPILKQNFFLILIDSLIDALIAVHDSVFFLQSCIHFSQFYTFTATFFTTVSPFHQLLSLSIFTDCATNVIFYILLFCRCQLMKEHYTLQLLWRS